MPYFRNPGKPSHHTLQRRMPKYHFPIKYSQVQSLWNEGEHTYCLNRSVQKSHHTISRFCCKFYFIRYMFGLNLHGENVLVQQQTFSFPHQSEAQLVCRKWNHEKSTLQFCSIHFVQSNLNNVYPIFWSFFLRPSKIRLILAKYISSCFNPL